jgi:uncharacterized protein (DUF1499 family)
MKIARGLVAGLGVAAVAGGFAAMSCKSPEVGLVDGRLRACPSSPNCVSSQDPDEDHRIEPLHFEGSAAAARARLLEVVKSMPRTRIVTDEEDYVHAEFRSFLFRFVDDVEFLIDAEAGRIEVRSASRTGYSDLGVNRRRVETLRAAFEAR